MKEQNKSRLKRIGSIALKVVTYGLAAFGLVCAVAMASGGCAPNDRNAEASTSVKKVMPKEAPDTQGMPNLFDDWSVYQWGFPFYECLVYASGDTVYVNHNTSWATYVYPMSEAGLYYLTLASLSDRVGFYCNLATDSVIQSLEYCFENDLSTTGSASNVTTLREWNPNTTYNAYVSRLLGGSSKRWVVVSVLDAWPEEVEFTLYDVDNAPAQETFDLPANWNPYVILGGTPNEYGYGTFTKNGDWQYTFDGFLFRSNGYLWNYMTFQTVYGTGNFVGYYDVQGILQTHYVTEANQYIIERVSFGQGSPIVPSWSGGQPVTNWVMTTPKTYVNDLVDPETGVAGSWVYLINEPHQWSDPNFRHIEVIDVTSATFTPTEYTITRPTLDWLRLSVGETNDFNPNTWVDGTYSPFTLIGNAFGSVVSLFSVMVLPGITLGLLIVLPLIAGIIVLIIKAVSK